MNPTETVAVEREVRIEARPETIFPFLTEPELMTRWMGTAAEADARPGGVYRVQVTADHVARGEYVDVTPHERVVFSWGWEGGDSTVGPGESTVEITLTPDGDATVVRLVHHDLPSTESAAAHSIGWEHYLSRLQVAAAGGDPGVDPWVDSPPGG